MTASLVYNAALLPRELPPALLRERSEYSAYLRRANAQNSQIHTKNGYNVYSVFGDPVWMYFSCNSKLRKDIVNAFTKFINWLETGEVGRDQIIALDSADYEFAFALYMSSTMLKLKQELGFTTEILEIIEGDNIDCFILYADCYTLTFTCKPDAI